MASQDLQWLLVRNNSSFIVKQKGLGRIFSREPRNLTQLHSYKYSGVVNTKAVGIEAAKSGKGIVLTTKNSKKAPSAIKATKNATTIKKGGGRRAAGVVSNVVAKKGYRADLTKAAVVRASALLRSQRGRSQPPARKVRGSGARKVVKVEESTA
ncbi:related to 60S ribosomal protein L28 [Ustilago trichophora]|uniref:Related to 60S ribosomal protein L28 n=1 Tax=Ustilago trichophora TaxID=86804 RepID=A0A5C3E1R4_9BASI|nr:related to 60S ribosomal protein L28 [Ustilago trichophora]SPO24221.1 related to 60S ribosomal protein L28 [Ustilago trichophora]